MHGRVTDVKTGEPIAGATVDIWQASTNGKIVNVDSPREKHVLSTLQDSTSNKTQSNAT